MLTNNEINFLLYILSKTENRLSEYATSIHGPSEYEVIKSLERMRTQRTTGGASKSAAKVEASKANGAKGGRPTA